MQASHLAKSARRTTHQFIRILPIVIGMLLLTSLAITLLPKKIPPGLFGGNEVVDAFIGSLIGSVSAGHPLASYVLGGELLKAGVSLTAVTALIVSWVTVGVVQLPAEILLLGARFAITRNLICFFSAVAISWLCAYSLQIIG